MKALKICLVLITIAIVITTGLFVYKFFTVGIDSSDYPHTILLIVSAGLITRAIARKEALNKEDSKDSNK